MGKRKHSTFIRQQKNNQRMLNKSTSNMNHSLNRSTKTIDRLTADYNKFANDTMDKFLKENGLENVPKNSKILVYEILKKNLETKLNQYETAIKELPKDEKSEILKKEYKEAIKVCKDNLSQIKSIYDWTSYWKGCDSNPDEFDKLANDDVLVQTNEVLKNSKLKFGDLTEVKNVIDTVEIENLNRKELQCDFYEFCRYILHTNKIGILELKHTYISGVIKNLMIIGSDDPINKYTLKGFINNGGDSNNELSISEGS